ncbi:MAG: T9SS type A sorting domain-containing protein [Chitinophagaceae bacterium]
MIRQALNIIAFIVLFTSSNAQSLTTSVLPTGGGSASAGGLQLNWTVGEPFAATALVGGNKILTPGFQQPELQVWTGFVPNTLYQGRPVTVPYKASGIISGSNVFTAELSDKHGNFNHPDVLANMVSNINGTITGNIPANSQAGDNYRIRVNSSQSPFIGPDNGYPLTIKQQFVVNVSPNPSKTYFGLAFSGTTGDPIKISVMDANGRIIESTNAVFGKGYFQLGATYRPGTYYATIEQGSQREVIVLIKLSN